MYISGRTMLVFVLCSALVAGGIITMRANHKAVAELSPLRTENQYVYGSKNADITIVAQIALDMSVARTYGGNATPFALIVFPDGTLRPVPGALPYEDWQRLLVQ